MRCPPTGADHAAPPRQAARAPIAPRAARLRATTSPTAIFIAAAFLAAAFSARSTLAQGIDVDDEPILIDDDEARAAEPDKGGAELDDGDTVILDDDDEGGVDSDGDDDELTIVEDDDQIVIIEEGKEAAPPPRISGALGRLWEALDISIDGSLEIQAQATNIEALGRLPFAADRAGEEIFQDRPLRTQLGGWIDTTLIPAQNLSFYANAFARVALDAGTGFQLVPIIDVYEAYAKINAEVGSVVLGRLVIPWGRTQVAALGDRLNPPDHRRAPQAFPDPVRLKQPQWGAQFRTSLGTVALEGVILTLYEATEGSLAAANQGGVRAARYQTALVRSPLKSGALLSGDDRTALVRSMDILEATTLGVRARQRVAGVDLGATAVWGVDEVPRLHLARPVARYLAQEAYLLEGHAPPPDPCPGPRTPEDVEACLGRGFIEHGRTASVSADIAYGLQNIVILKAEVLAHPQFGFLPGKTALVVDENGLRSVQVGHYGAALAVEGGYGDWIAGSLEVFDLVWAGVPEGARLWGVEIFLFGLDGPRVVNRLGIGWSFAGSLFSEALDWKVRGELGVFQLDTLVSAEVRYRLPVLNLYVGSRGNLFAGWPGSPGWMRQDASLIGVFVGEGA